MTILYRSGNLFMEGINILLWGESEFGIHGKGCYDAIVHHFIVLMSPCFFVLASDEPFAFNFEFSEVMKPYCSNKLILTPASFLLVVICIYRCYHSFLWALAFMPSTNVAVPDAFISNFMASASIAALHRLRPTLSL